MKYNTTQVIPRHNRPSVQQNTLLELYITNTGSYYDPVAVSSVLIFKDTIQESTELQYVTNGLAEPLMDLEPSSVRYGLVKESLVDQAVFRFAWNKDNIDASATSQMPGEGNFPFGEGNGASGIYKTTVGQFAVVLDPNASSVKSSADPVTYTFDDEIGNGASAAGVYFDVWTVKNLETGNWETHSHQFKLVQDRILTSTEALSLTLSTQLKQKYVELGSKVSLTFLNNFTIENRNIERAIRDSFRESVLDTAEVRLVKINEGPQLTSRYVVEDFGVRPGLVRITSDDTVLFTFNTADLMTAAATDPDFGPPGGVYEVQLRMTYLNTISYSPKFRIVVR